jgi:hypothetical protein
MTDQEIVMDERSGSRICGCLVDSGVDYRMLYDMNQIPIVCRDNPLLTTTIFPEGRERQRAVFMSLGYYHTNRGFFKFVPDETESVSTPALIITAS